MKDSTKDTAAGTLHEVKGAIKSQIGKLTNDPDLEADGIVENNIRYHHERHPCLCRRADPAQ